MPLTETAERELAQSLMAGEVSDAVVDGVCGGADNPLFLEQRFRLRSQLRDTIRELCATGLISGGRQLPEPAYRFHHALIQQTTYGGMLRAQRRQFDARAAWGLEAASADRPEEVAAVLGHHFAVAGETERAGHYLEVAGDHAVSVCANDEAISSYRSALAVVGPGHPADGFMAAVQVRFKLAYVLYCRSVGGGSQGRRTTAAPEVRKSSSPKRIASARRRGGGGPGSQRFERGGGDLTG